MHLPAPRRHDFRHARDVLLQAQGHHTLCALHGEPPTSPSGTFALDEPSTPRSAPPSRFWLRDHDRVFPLKVGVNTVGRAPENDVVLTDGYVSRRHCAILVHLSTGCELHDTASKNGTFLNGSRLAGPTRLSSGDEIRMCDRHLVFVSADGAGPAAHEPTLAG